MRFVEDVLKGVRLSVKPMTERQLHAIFSTLLSMSSDGVLITDLNHHSLACNETFGRIFRVDPEHVTHMEPEELRSYVYPRLKDPEAWKQQLDSIYAHPELHHKDELVLTGDEGDVCLVRRTGPVHDGKGEIIGRYWCFQDVTEEKDRERRREAMRKVSSYFHPEPGEVCRYVIETLAQHYGSLALLSIWEGDKMMFRQAANVPDFLRDITYNNVKDAYCQVAIKTVKPVLIQDAREDSRVCSLLPIQFGFTRCLGAPLLNSEGKPIGTICFMDDRTQESLTDEDVEFVTLLAQRVSTELERERLYQERTAEQHRVIDRQKFELGRTEEVLHAMNSAIQLLGRPLAYEELVRYQLSLLNGVLGYRSSAIVTALGQQAQGIALLAGKKKSVEFSLAYADNATLDSLLSAPRNFIWEGELDGDELKKALSSQFGLIARLQVESGPPTFVIFGSKTRQNALADPFLATLLVALIDQIALLITASRLQFDLSKANLELQATQGRLIQSEKLSVVGTLAASIAHDIRNIVASMSLECSMPVADIEAFRSSIRDQLDRFSLLSHRLLSYSKPKEQVFENIDLHELIRRCSDLLAAQFKMWKCHLLHDFQASHPTVRADASRAEHLFVNLLLNSLHAMNSEGGKIQITTSQLNNEIVIVVKDSGRGMDQQTLERLFVPFSSTRSDGFGLGLFSCKQIADEHGWTILVDSVKGEGTVFQIRVPLGREQE